MGERMRAAAILKPGQVEVQEVPKPVPGPGEVVIALEGTGVCASNLPLWEGAPWLQYPLSAGTGGHEAWGRIEHVGEGVSPRWEGKRVCGLSYRSYAEHDVARVDQVLELPADFAGKPFPGEALGCAVNIFARSDIRAGHTVAIVGVGFLGALLTQLARHVGARVLAISRREDALATAAGMGADVLIPMRDHHAILEQVCDLTRGRMCERTIEATGKQWPLDLAAELTAEGGRLVIAGYHQDGPRTVNMQLWNWRGFDAINAHERDPQVSLRGMREAIRLVQEGVLSPESLYTHAYELAELGKAFATLEERPRGFMKALIRVGESSC
jgi:threonine dehydrogenase-like Zn-dependent dehydrogenase